MAKEDEVTVEAVEKAEARKPTQYKAFTQDEAGVLTPILEVTALGQLAAKKAVATELSKIEEWATAMSGAGVTLVVVPAKSFVPELVKIEVPAPRVSIGS